MTLEEQRGRGAERHLGRLLILGPYDIWEPTSGAELRSLHLARQLSAFLQVVYLCFRRDVGGQPERRALAAPGGSPLELWRIPRPQMYTFPKLLRGIFGWAPLTLLNYTCPAMAQALSEVFKERRFDFLQIESAHMAAYLEGVLSRPDRPQAVICDWHNVDSELMSRYRRHGDSVARRLYAAQTVPKIRAAERALLRRATAHLAVSECDRHALLEIEPRANVFVVENGVDVEFLAKLAGPDPGEGDPRRFRVLFVGAMDYHANVEAVERFAREVWPLVRERPGLVFTIVGRSPAASVRALAEMPDVEVTGTVADVRPFYREALVQVVPLRIGGGTRLKILESMAAGVPVVTTALGAEGLRAQPGKDYLLAESPGDFRDCIGRLAENPRLVQRLTESAWDLVRRHYDWSATCAPLRGIYAGLAGDDGSESRPPT